MSKARGMGIKTTFDFFENQTFGWLEDVANAAGQTYPDWINTGEPRSLVGRFGQAADRAVCRNIASNPDRYKQNDIEVWAEACEPYLKSIGEWPGGPAPGAPVAGGQCPIFYVMQVNTTFDDALGDEQNSNSGEIVVRGPIQGAIMTSLSGIINPGDFGGFTGRIAAVVGADGAVGAAGFSPPAANNPRNPQIINLRPQNPALPDDCGNSPGPYQPPTGTGNPSGGVPPKSPPDFQPSIDVEPQPDGSIEVNIDGDPAFTYAPNTGPTGDGGAGGSGGPGSPGQPSDSGLGEEVEGEAPANEVLTGLRINILQAPENGGDLGDGNFRGAAFIYIGTEDGLDLDPAGTILRDGQFVFAEVDYATRWRVVAAPRYNLRVTPFYRPVEE